MTSTRKFYLYTAAFVALGVLLRVLNVVFLTNDDNAIGDRWFYHATGQLIARGQWFLEPNALVFGGKELASAGHPPLFPLLLGFASYLGIDSYQAHQFVGVFFGAIAIFVTGLLGRKVAGDRTGLIAAALAAVYPIFIGADGSLMSESLYGLLIVTTLLLAYRAFERPTVARLIWLGVVIALAALTRGEAILLIVFLVLPLVWKVGGKQGKSEGVDGRTPQRTDSRWQRRLVDFAVVVGAAAVVLVPWAARNYSEFDRFVPISTNESTVLAGANCAATYHGQDIGSWRFDCLGKRVSDNEAVQADAWRKQGLDYIKNNFTQLATEVVPVRFLRTWSLYQPRRSTTLAEGEDPDVNLAGTVMYFLLVPFAVVGLLMLRRRKLPLFILLAPVWMVIFTSVVGYGYPRFRHAAEFTLVVCAAVAIDQAMKRLAARRQVTAQSS